MIVIVFSTLIFACIWIFCYSSSKNSNYIISLCNQFIKSECDQQDMISLNGIPSYHNVWDSSNKSAIELHRMIYINHDEILAEVTELLESNYDKLSEGLNNEDGWNPIWIKFLNTYSTISQKLPKLKSISELFPEVITFYISIFHPGNILVERKGTLRIAHRYHYGLKIPENDVGLKISGFNVKWEEKEGFVWDDTLSHSAWNHGIKPRIVIFAHVLRDLSFINKLGSNVIYSLLQNKSM